MWRRVEVSDYSLLISCAIEFTGDHEKYGRAMIEVTEKWHRSCEHNLTDIGQNRRAWIGHAACQLAINCPEYIVREAWGMLIQEQRDAANAVADIAIEKWVHQHEKENSGMGAQMELAGISRWDTGRSAASA